MKTKKLRIIVAALLLPFFALVANGQGCITCTTPPCLTLQWSAPYNNSYSNQDYGRAITTDASGNCYVTGQATVGVNGNGDKECSVVTIKYTPSGSIASGWPQTVGNTNNCPQGSDDNERGNAIAIDAQGNIWVVATMQNGSTNHYDMALIEYNSSGTLQSGYPKYLSEASTGCDFTEAPTLVARDAEHVYIGGSSTNAGNYYGKVLMNNPSGGWYWTYSFNGTSLTNAPYNETYDMKINSTGTYLYISGCKNNGTAGGDVFVAKLDASSTGGTASWTQTYNFGGGSDNNDFSYAIYLDASENSYLAGKTNTGSSQGYNGFVMKYNSTGTQQWISTYNYNNQDDAYVDICGTGVSNHTSLVYATGYRTVSPSGVMNADYITAAYNISTGALSPYWTQNPRIYDGSAVGGSGGEALSTDHGYAVKYDATYGKVFVTGRSFDTLCPGTGDNINITTLRYSGITGAQEWKASYDYGTDGINSYDEVDTKNTLAIRGNPGCAFDDVFVTGESWGGGTQWFNYLTMKYSTTCGGNLIGGGDDTLRIMNPNQDKLQTAFYPNPFSTTATLQIGGADVSNATLTIFDISGKAMRVMASINTNTIEIKKNDLQNGMYYYRLTDDFGDIASGKFVIEE